MKKLMAFFLHYNKHISAISVSIFYLLIAHSIEINLALICDNESWEIFVFLIIFSANIHTL